MGDHLRGQVSNLSVLEAKLADEVGPGRDVDDGARDGFVERRMGVAKTPQALAVTEGLGECFAKAKESVLGRVVVVNCATRLVACPSVLRFGRTEGGKEERKPTRQISEGAHSQTPPRVFSQRV